MATNLAAANNNGQIMIGMGKGEPVADRESESERLGTKGWNKEEGRRRGREAD